MNTITAEQKGKLWELFDAYTECHSAPDFWSICEVDDRGNSVPESEATYVEVCIQDYDNRHDLDFLAKALQDVGVELNCEDMLDSWDLSRLEADDAPRPRKGALVDGDGVLGRVYGLQLIFERA